MSDFRAGTYDISIHLAIYEGRWRVLAIDPETNAILPFAIEYLAFPKPMSGHHEGANEVYVLGPFSINVPPDAIYEKRPTTAAASAPTGERSS
jgi:hypothetical protein